jgi:hypothetical protein
LEEKLEEAIDILSTQIDVVDKLLKSHGVTIIASHELHARVREQRNKRKAPFKIPHKDNYNDADLIFTALNYLTLHNESELYFISGNEAEFGFGKPPILHPDITELFNKVKVYYFTDLKDAFLAFDQLNIPRHESKKEQQHGKIINKVAIDKTKPILDQLYEYLEKRMLLWSFIPKKMLFEHYPFILSNVFRYSHRPFTIITDNKDVFDLLTKIKIENGVVACEDPCLIQNNEYEKKISFIFKALRQNNIERVAFKDDSEVNIIYTPSSTICNCQICVFKRIDWTDILDLTHFPERVEIEENLDEKIKIAYGQYKVGNYYKSALLFEKLLNDYSNQNDILVYIIKFNLKHLAAIIRNNYWDDSEKQRFADKLSDIDLEKAYEDCETFEDQEILQWLHRKDFIKQATLEMHDLTEQITDHFYGRNSGYNDNTLSLLETYLEAESFLDKNSIIYDYYSEFKSLTNLLTHGLFASYGCNPLLGGKLISFNDNNLNKLLFSGNAEIIQKYLIRFKLENMKYESDSPRGQTIFDVIVSLIEKYNQIQNSYYVHKQTLSNYFWDTYTNLINNSLTILAMIDLPEDKFNIVVAKILTLLETPNHLIYHRIFKHLRFLFNKKHKSLSDDLLYSFSIAGLKDRKFHSDRFFEVLAGIINDREIKVPVSDQHFQLIRENFLDNQYINSADNSWFDIGYIFGILESDEQKKEIRSHLKQLLEANYKSHNYYLASMFDIIMPEETFNNLYDSEIEAIIDLGPIKRPFHNKQYFVDTRIDNYLNFCLKHSLTVPTQIRNKSVALGPYYQWLFDMESFNYDNFNKDWLYNHFTLYFKQAFRKSEKLKSHLLKLIKDDPNTEIERIFVITYCFSD